MVPSTLVDALVWDAADYDSGESPLEAEMQRKDPSQPLLQLFLRVVNRADSDCSIKRSPLRSLEDLQESVAHWGEVISPCHTSQPARFLLPPASTLAYLHMKPKAHLLK